MRNEDIMNSIKKLWAQGITASNVIINALNITIEQYEEAISKINQEYLDYNKDSFWSKYIIQTQNRYLEIEDIKNAALNKNKHQVALECVKAKADLDFQFINSAKDFGVFEKNNDKINKEINKRKYESLEILKKQRGEIQNELDSTNVSSNS